MKITKTILTVFAAAALLSTTAFADDFGFGDSSSAGSTDSSSEAEPTVTVGGTVKMDARVYLDDPDDTDPDVKDYKTQAVPDATLNVDFAAASTDVSAKFNFSEDSIKTYNSDVIEEFTARAYLGNFVFEAGKEKLVWGKGDKLHVVDNFCANDYTDYIIPDYIDRRLAEPMFHLVYNAPSGSWRAEAVYTPLMTPDRLATSGVWVPAQSTKLTKLVTNVETAKVAKTYTTYTTLTATAAAINTAYAEYQTAAYLYSQDSTTYASVYASTKAAYDAIIYNAGLATSSTATTTTEESSAPSTIKSSLTSAATEYLTTLTAASSFDSDSLYPDTYTLKYGQAGLRTTFTIGAVDLGLSYYYGHNKQPSVNLENYIASSVANSGTSYELPELNYDQLQVFGAEAAFVLGPFNTRWEAAYNLTKDVDGDDPWVHNNSVAWVGGFDMDLPIHNVNINIQETGKYILHGDEIKDGTYAAYDVDYDANNCFTNNKLVVNISDTYNHENVKPEVSCLYGIERGDVLVMPKLTITAKPNFNIIVSGLYMWCKDEDSEFYAWRNNSFGQIGVKYQF